jgi:hypothetical protein
MVINNGPAPITQDRSVPALATALTKPAASPGIYIYIYIYTHTHMCIICVLCLIVAPMPPAKNPFAVKINNKKSEETKGGL